MRWPGLSALGGSFLISVGLGELRMAAGNWVRPYPKTSELKSIFYYEPRDGFLRTDLHFLRTQNRFLTNCISFLPNRKPVSSEPHSLLPHPPPSPRGEGA